MINIYVGNLPYSVKDEELREAFEAYGKVLSAEVIFDRRTRRSRGYGFVEMENDGEGRAAIEALNGKDFQGRELRVDESKPKEDKPRDARPSAAPGTDSASPAAAAGDKAAGNEAAGETPGGVAGFFRKLFG